MKKKQIIWIAVGVSIVIIAAVIIALVVSKSGKKEKTEDPTTTAPSKEYDASGAYTSVDGVTLTEVEGLSLSKGGLNAKIVTDAATGKYYISVLRDGYVALNASQLGIDTADCDFTEGMSYVADSKTESEGKDEYTLTTGASRVVSDEYTEMSFTLSKDSKELKIVVRAYDEGVAYRYILTGASGESLVINGEASEFVLPDAATLWTGYDGVGNYEYPYSKFTATSIKLSSSTYSAPLLATSDDMWMLITEAAVFSAEEPYCSSSLNTSSGSKSLKLKFGKGQSSTVTMTYTEAGSVTLPWRVIIASKDLNDIVTSTMVTSLNPAYDETLYADSEEWIQTGKVAWSWWSESGDDPVEYDQQKNYIDFAAVNGWEYVCIDFGWCLWDDYEEKIAELVKYADERDVKIMLWYGVNNDNHTQQDSTGASAYPKYSVRSAKQLEAQFAWCEEVGVSGVKVDYFEQDDKAIMQLMKDCATIAAQHKLNVLFHGCTAPKGEQRTYPNVLSYEAVQGAEGYKWNNGPSAANCLLYIFNRNVVGGMDFTPVGTKVTQYNFTAGFQLAQLVAYQSGFVNVAASVYKLEGYSGLAMINDIPVVWDETKLLAGDPGVYNVLARRNGEDWYISAMTAAKRDISFKLDFLGDGEYNAYIYTDTEDGTDLVWERKKVTKDSTLPLSLLSNGGAVVKISKAEMNTTTIYDSYDFYEAESDANTLSGNAKISTNQYASGMRQVSGLGGTNEDSLTFNNISVSEDGVYEMRLYYSTGVEKRIHYSINGGDKIKSVGLNAGVNTLAMEIFYVELKAGDNTIAFSNNAGSAPNIDRIAISKAKVALTATVSDPAAENEEVDEGATYSYTSYGITDAVLAGGARIENGGIGWLGNGSGCTATFTVSVETAGKYKLCLKYYAGETRNTYVTANDSAAVMISCPNTGSYAIDSVSNIYLDVDLKAGENTIMLNNPSGWCPNIGGIGISTTTVK